jgi:hypothetical protein
MSKPDHNYAPGGFADRAGKRIGPLLLDPPDQGAGLDDIFKTSGCTDSKFLGITVRAGRQGENGWDANRFCRRNEYRGLQIDGGAQCAVYLKCGFSHNVVEDVLITKAGGNSDWFEGDFSDYYVTSPRGATVNRGNTYRNVRRADGKPVRVRWVFTRAEKPRFADSRVEYQYLRSLLSTVYVECKTAWLRLKS